MANWLYLIGSLCFFAGTIINMQLPDKDHQGKHPNDTGFWADGVHYNAQGYDKNGIHYYTHNSAMRGRRYS